ncbi:hypothetical protein [uncultured Pseudodesulfovibrio sp.]|uniref:hypothetical protein n=1 Tax=uncultured Pseudodesulfovibrio sp. TaxID=2035858 RepID=UPI0029C862B4|nr:hypothetical protein [uncultured Pseudodesulfovibrio sp.]
MADRKDEKRGEINGMSYGKIMTSLLIPKDARTNPRRILSGIAFLAFVCFFVFGTLYRSCTSQDGTAGQPDAVQMTAPAEPQAPGPGGES